MTALAGAVLGFLTGCGWCCLLAMHWRRVSVRALEEAATATRTTVTTTYTVAKFNHNVETMETAGVLSATPTAIECRRLYDLPSPKESRP